MQLDLAHSFFELAAYRRLAEAAEQDSPAGAQSPGRAHESDPAQRVGIVAQRAGRMQQQQFRAAAAFAPADEPRRDDARLVEHEHVVALQQCGKIGEPAVCYRATVEHHEPTAVATRRRVLRDKILRQLVIVCGRWKTRHEVTRDG